MTDSNLISVITPAFNCMSFLPETYNCLLNQSYRHWEWIVTDDCSQDNSAEYLSSVSLQDSRVKLIKHTVNRGAACARNTSITASNGRYIAFLDSDDLWLPDKLKLQLAFIRNHKCAISFTPFFLVDEFGNNMGKKVWDLKAPNEVTYEKLLKKKATFGCSTVMIDRRKTGFFHMPNLRTGQDFATWLMLLRRELVALKYPDPLSSYRVVAGSLSRNKIKKAIRQWQIYRQQEGFDLHASAYYFLNYAYRAIVRP